MENEGKDVSDKQRKSLIKLKANLADILTSDHTDTILLKWLRARNFDVKATEVAFRQNHNNRIIFGINTILDTYQKHEVAKNYEANGVIGFAKDGTLIQYMNLGQADFYGFIMSMSCTDLGILLCSIMESDIQTLKEESLRTGKYVDEVTYIMDMEGFRIQEVLHKCVIEMGLDFFRLLQDCYPGIWRRLLFVNVSAIFNVAFKIFKPALRASIIDSIKFANKDSSPDLLLKYIDDDVLPAFLGGKRVDSLGDPMCREFLTFGGKVSERFYSQNWSNELLLSCKDPGVKCVVIGQRSAYNHSLVVQEGGTVAKLEARCESGSLAFSIFFKEFEEDSRIPDFPGENESLEENGEYEMVSIGIRAQLHCCPMNLHAFLQKPGLYVFRFSNAGNWFTSRNVLIRLTLLPPKSQSTVEQPKESIAH